MKTKLFKMLPGLIMLGLTACASTNLEEMDQLDGNGAREALIGKTQTYSTEYGKWAEYIQSDQLTGVGRASGDWGAEKANATHTISDSGEVCTQYQGDHDWSDGQHQFCGVYYMDVEGAMYYKVTVDTYKPKRVGQTNRVSIAEGDKYNLMN